MKIDISNNWKKCWSVFIGPIRRAGIAKAAQWLNKHVRIDDHSGPVEEMPPQREADINIDFRVYHTHYAV